MGKKYYGGIGTDKGFVMGASEDDRHNHFDGEIHAEESEKVAGNTNKAGSVRNDFDNEFHARNGERNVGGKSNTGGTHNESSDESPGGVQGNFDASCDDDCSNHNDNDDDRDECDDELDGFFGGLFSIKACIALAIESLFKALMSRSMGRVDFVAVTLMLLVCTRVIGAVFIDSSSLSELNAFAFVVALSALGMCTISEKCPANALTALVIACLPALIEVATTCAVNGSDADAFNRITNWALVGCLGSAGLLIAGTLIDPFGDEEGEDEDTSMDGGKGTSTNVNMGVSACESEGTTAHEDAAYERVFFIPFWGAAIGATAALIWELAPYIARKIAYGAAPLYFSYMGGIV